MIEAQAMKDNGMEGVQYDDNGDAVETETDPAVDPNAEPNAPAPVGGDTPTVGATGPDQNVQQLALNGAQVTALVDMVEKVASGTLPRESALNMIVTAFNVTPQDAEKILGSAGKGFKTATPEPIAPPANQGGLNEGDQQDGQ